jgi:hypothetical protein
MPVKIPTSRGKIPVISSCHDEQLRLCTDNRCFGWRRFRLEGRGRKFSFQGLPTIEALLSWDLFLRIAELKTRRKNPGIGHI